MSIKVGVIQDPELQELIFLLNQYPEIANKYFRPALKQAVTVLEGMVRPRIPRATGKAEATFGSKVSGGGLSLYGRAGLTGRVGWFDYDDPWYINVVEYGAKAHEINSFAPGLGKYIGTHPGFSAVGFMAAGYSAAQPVIEALMDAANDATLQALKT